MDDDKIYRAATDKALKGLIEEGESLELLIIAMRKDIEYIKKEIDKIEKDLEGLCERCLVRKVVYAVVGLVGVGVVGAIMALILRTTK